MRIVTIVGARPQFIKAAVVSKALQEAGTGEELIVHTGQHYDENLSDVFFKELGLPPPVHALNVGSGSHGHQTGQMLERVETVLEAEKPDLVLVYGDTNSTLAGALAAAKLRIPVGHVEAGLRSYNRSMPEEVNRVIVDHLAELLFAPSRVGAGNLEAEGITPERIHIVGDVMYDATRMFAQLSERRSTVLRDVGLNGYPFVLATIHRAENTDRREPLEAIVRGLALVADSYHVLMPLHPRTRAALAVFELELDRRIRVLEPVGYLDMLSLERHATAIVTDSGGVQKEAFFQGTPCITLRGETEWTELIEGGWNTLVAPTCGRAVYEGILAALNSETVFPGEDLYGDGNAGEHIARILWDYIDGR